MVLRGMNEAALRQQYRKERDYHNVTSPQHDIGCTVHP